VGHFCQIDELLVELMMENRVLKKSVLGDGSPIYGYAAAEKSRIIRLVEQSSLVATAHPGPDQSQHPREYEFTSTRRAPAINLPTYGRYSLRHYQSSVRMLLRSGQQVMFSLALVFG
jgi:hypothetical protein